ncbi:hypothetical protein E2C01_047597 [Portunus trituberculatus]|uniref:Uncharacterized protein n=1 Tax=Portunus trituberculatus TaxID=210409 RepID=A0A5B7G7W7_PORTR|nr:hypothetical protein [Portunus trituberculatus]
MFSEITINFNGKFTVSPELVLLDLTGRGEKQVEIKRQNERKNGIWIEDKKGEEGGQREGEKGTASQVRSGWGRQGRN